MEAKYKKCNTQVLRDKLRRRELPTDGEREEWIKRLLKYDIDVQESEDQSSDDEIQNTLESATASQIEQDQISPRNDSQNRKLTSENYEGLNATGDAQKEPRNTVSWTQNSLQTGRTGPRSTGAIPRNLSQTGLTGTVQPPLNVQTTEAAGPLGRTNFAFTDIESSIRKFSGDDHYQIQKWVQQFEEMAIIMQWNAIQQIIYAKRCLTGTALMTAQLQTHQNWQELKDALVIEFNQQKTSAEVHKLLSQTRAKRGENTLTYVIRMQEIAAQCHIEDASLIQYIISGINDKPENKILLCGSNTVHELKAKIRVYETFRQQTLNTIESTYTSGYRRNVKENRQGQTTGIKCEFCKRLGHTEAECRTKKMVCYECKKTGHKATTCPGRGDTTKNASKDVLICNRIQRERSMYKNISINSYVLDALLDTGSEVNILREDHYWKIANRPEMEKPELTLSGIGSNSIRTLGFATFNVNIDDQKFKLELHIVKKSDLPIAVVLGQQFLNSAKVTIGPELIIEKYEDTEVSMDNNIFNISIDSQESSIPDVVQTMIKEYNPKTDIQTDVQTTIILKDDNRSYQSPRRLAQKEKEIVEQQLKEWLEKGIISRSTSEYASPIVLVKKKDGSMRLCIDYRRLNKNIIKERFPFPDMQEQLDQLQNARIFSTLDLENGFFHVPMEKHSKKYTAFCTHKGVYEFNKTPFGLCNSPSSFQRFINSVFQDLINEGAVILYMDDIIIPANNYEQGVERLKKVLKVAADNGLRMKWSKSQFLQSKVEYLGFIIENGKIQPMQHKLDAVINFPEPKNVKHIQSFLGLTGFFRKFIHNYALISLPLSDMLKKIGFFDLAKSR